MWQKKKNCDGDCGIENIDPSLEVEAKILCKVQVIANVLLQKSLYSQRSFPPSSRNGRTRQEEHRA
jgi:hypothetical protein